MALLRRNQTKLPLHAQEIHLFPFFYDLVARDAEDADPCRRNPLARRRSTPKLTGVLRSNRMMRVIDADGTRRWVRVDGYAATLTADDSEPIVWPTQEDSKVVYAHLVKTWMRRLGPCQVLIVKLNPDDDLEHVHYWATSRLDDTLEEVVGHVAQRWIIEVLFADFKELMGG